MSEDFQFLNQISFISLGRKLFIFHRAFTGQGQRLAGLLELALVTSEKEKQPSHSASTDQRIAGRAAYDSGSEKSSVSAPITTPRQVTVIDSSHQPRYRSRVL